MDIDWRAAPDWVKGHGLISQGGPIKEVWYSDVAYMILGDSRSYPFGGGVGATQHNHTLSQIQFKRPRPAPWTGEGLPPAGTVCEVSSHQGAWAKAEIRYIGKRFCVYQYVLQEGYSADQLNEVSLYLTVMRFRPIRTPEQIAEEEREQAAIELHQTIHPRAKWENLDGGMKASYRAAITLGWHKQAKP